MKTGYLSIPAVLRNIVCAVLVFWLMLAAPTGWLYDLRSGAGMEQGQRPGEGVYQLRRREDVLPFFYEQTPAMVTGGHLVACPLARLRDTEPDEVRL